MLLVTLTADAREGIQVQELAGEAAPWTSTQANDYSGKFHFVVVADKTGGKRPQIWSRGIAKINLMQLVLVISVGDLIQGYTPQKSVVLYFYCLRISDRNTELITIHE